ncbi:MAG: class I SAM-dependent methyltransferase [Nanoarchaeales archaeon]|nr:class I SAM-dependent methyltransferase [Nanoarchaeales archaeon]
MSEWNKLDDFISKWRCKKVFPYLDKKLNCLDIGCGQNGRFLFSIKDRINSGVGFDLKLKNELINGNITLKKGDFNIDNTVYDVVTLMAVLEHIHNRVDFLKLIYNKLALNGKFILTVPDKSSQWLLEFMAYKLKIINREEIEDHKHYYNKLEIIKV